MNVLCPHHDGDRQAAPQLRVCWTCRDRLADHIAALPDLHDRLQEHLAPGGGGGQRVTGTATPPLPINPTVAEHRDQIRHDLAWWVRYVADARGHALPADRLADIAAWLGRHVDWLAADPVAAEECPPVMRGLVGRAHGLLDPDRRLATGERCRNAPQGAERCTGVIAMVQAADETWVARCTVCGPQEAAPYLRDTLAARLVTIERVEAFVLRRYGLRVARATIRSWAARGNVKTTAQDGQTWYDLGSVQRYLSNRERVSA